MKNIISKFTKLSLIAIVHDLIFYTQLFTPYLFPPEDKYANITLVLSVFLLIMAGGINYFLIVRSGLKREIWFLYFPVLQVFYFILILLGLRDFISLDEEDKGFGLLLMMAVPTYWIIFLISTICAHIRLYKLNRK